LKTLELYRYLSHSRCSELLMDRMFVGKIKENGQRDVFQIFGVGSNVGSNLYDPTNLDSSVFCQNKPILMVLATGEMSARLLFSVDVPLPLQCQRSAVNCLPHMMNSIYGILF